GRIEGDGLRLQPGIVLGNLLRLGEARTQGFEERSGRHAANGELAGAREESPAVDDPVHVLVEEAEHFRMEVARLCHGPWSSAAILLPCLALHPCLLRLSRNVVDRSGDSRDTARPSGEQSSRCK